MPTANTDSLLAGALTKVKHRNSEMVKRDVLTTLHHYRGSVQLLSSPNKFPGCHFVPSLSVCFLSLNKSSMSQVTEESEKRLPS